MWVWHTQWPIDLQTGSCFQKLWTNLTSKLQCAAASPVPHPLLHLSSYWISQQMTEITGTGGKKLKNIAFQCVYTNKEACESDFIQQLKQPFQVTVYVSKKFLCSYLHSSNCIVGLCLFFISTESPVERVQGLITSSFE